MSTVKLPCSLALLAQWGEEEEDFKQMGRKRGGGEIFLGFSSGVFVQWNLVKKGVGEEEKKEKLACWKLGEVVEYQKK